MAVFFLFKPNMKLPIKASGVELVLSAVSPGPPEYENIFV